MTISTAVTAQNGGYLKIKVTGVAAVTVGGIGYLANPEGVPLGITRAWVYFRTGSTGAATFDAGIVANLTVAEDHSLLDFAAAIQATVGGKFVYGPTAQVAITENPTLKWGATDLLVFQSAQSTVGLDADVYIEYIRLA